MHEHGHSHNQSIQFDSLNRAFVVGIVLNFLFVLIEFGSGIWLDSLALISDAGHNLSDVISLIVALWAFRLMKKKPNEHFTYGYKKSSILASLFNACVLLIAVGFIIAESVKKLNAPEPVEGDMIALVAGAGIVINALTALLLMRYRKKDLNVKGAYLHMVADTLVSVGVVISGIIIGETGWYVIDPLIGIVIGVVILVSTIGLLLSSLRLSLDGVPVGIDATEIKELMLDEDERIVDIHHIHIWAISTTENALTAHVVVKSADDMEDVKCGIKHLLLHHQISHTTLEFEIEGDVKCDENECD
ncbi:MAG: cation diffusion facilitator family transporter [Culturomica sp.]|jgi:cobalt-zinc-cadmium efflux system protein|nr:cation diffusion facilitator family transporter [Culturomica sp.]